MRLIYPGTFDPFHNGHLEVVKQVLKLMPDAGLTIAIMTNPDKGDRLFSMERTIDQLIKIVSDTDLLMQIDCTCYHPGERLASIVKSGGYNAIVRGVRNANDAEDEIKRSQYFLKYFGIPTILIPTISDLSSSMIRELVKDNHQLALENLIPGYKYLKD